MSEEWRSVLGWEGWYEVSDQGRVRSLPRVIPHAGKGSMRIKGKLMTPQWWGHEGKKYLGVGLSRQSQRQVRRVHQMVLEAFVGPRPEGMFGCHNNGDTSDNRLSNLRWDTPASNMQDSLRHGTHWLAKRTHCDRGHPFSPENTYWFKTRRICKTCHQARTAAYRQRRRERKQAAA